MINAMPKLEALKNRHCSSKGVWNYKIHPQKSFDFQRCYS